MEDPMTRAKLLRALMHDMGMAKNQAAFAKTLGCTQSWVSRLLRDKGTFSEEQMGRVYCLSVGLGDEARKRFSLFLKTAGGQLDG